MAKKSKHKGRAGPASKGAQANTARAVPAPVAPTPDPVADTDTAQASDVGAAQSMQAVVAQAAGDEAAGAMSADESLHTRDDSAREVASAPDDAATAAPAPVAFTAVPAPAIDLTPVDVVHSGVGNPDDIRGVLIQLLQTRLLLPNATIAEVMSYADPEPIAGVPEWMLGRIRWRGWQLPLVAFSKMAGLTEERAGLGSKVVVLKALSGGKTPYFAVLTQGFPRLVTVSRGALVVDEDATDLPDALMARVTLNQDEAYLPDLARVEALIGQALAQAA